MNGKVRFADTLAWAAVYFWGAALVVLLLLGIARAAPVTEVLSVRPHMLHAGLPLSGYADVEVQLSDVDAAGIRVPMYFADGIVRASVNPERQRCALRPPLGVGTVLRYWRQTCTMALDPPARVEARALFDDVYGGHTTPGTFVEAAPGSLDVAATWARFYCYGTGDGSGTIPSDPDGRVGGGGSCCDGAWQKPEVGWVCR